jgi:hypothetical protein
MLMRSIETVVPELHVNLGGPATELNLVIHSLERPEAISSSESSI